MTQIEKAVRAVSDLCRFYRRIPKIAVPCSVPKAEPQQPHVSHTPAPSR